MVVPQTSSRLPRRLHLGHDLVRVYRQLRSAHLERAASYRPATILYEFTRYDFDPELVGDLDVVACSNGRMVALLLFNPVAVLEINEPLARGALTRSALAVATVRVGGRLRGSRTEVVTYAIENLDPFTARAGLSTRSALRRRLDRRLSSWIAGQLDRIAYGTSSSAELHRELFTAELDAAARLIPALPARCACLDGLNQISRATDTVTFLGALDDRKGIRQVLRAWEVLERRHPAAHLLVIGKGPLAAEVADFASTRPQVSFVVDPPRDRIHELLCQTSVLVLLSQRSTSWREQVGLPIVEALAHGSTVVTTTETGLASWLVEHGHLAIDPDADADVTAAAVLRALLSDRAAESVLADLPDTDGRQQAETWMTEPTGVGT